MTDPVKTLIDMNQGIEKQLSIGVVPKDGSSVRSSGADVIESAVKLNPQRPCHGSTSNLLDRERKDLTPGPFDEYVKRVALSPTAR